MANIETKKTLLIDSARKPASALQLALRPGAVVIAIENELVTHLASLDPQEAAQMGVALIQLAGKAQELAAAQRVQLANGIPVPPPAENGRPG